MTADRLQFMSAGSGEGVTGWKVPLESVAFDEEGVRSRLLSLNLPCFAVRDGERVGVSNEAAWAEGGAHRRGHPETLAWAPALPMERLGDAAFREAHGTAYAYYAGAMAGGIASARMVAALGKEGFLGSFGAAGLLPGRIAEAIEHIQRALPNGPYAFNLIHTPNEPRLEQQCVDLYLAHRVRCVEAAAYLEPTPSLVQYRAAGLGPHARHGIEIQNRIIAKVSRREVAVRFMEPAPQRILKELLGRKLITQQQADLSREVPLADDVTAEADSAGHTDNRPLVALLPSMLALRDEIQTKQGYRQPVRVGAAGGIATPAAALAAFFLGAAYVVTGSINQSCIEAGTCGHVRKLLAEADMADVIMAPAADMFEMGVKLQVLKRGTLFPMRAQKLHDLYQRYGSIEEIPLQERAALERQIFRDSLDSIWERTAAFFGERDPSQVQKAERNPKQKLALTFRWYLGLSSLWALAGEPAREMDYQIWCGPSMGAFNAWVRNSYLEDPANRRVADVARHILAGAAFSFRVRNLAFQGVRFPPAWAAYRPGNVFP